MGKWLHLACGTVFDGKTCPFECSVCHGLGPGWKYLGRSESRQQRRVKDKKRQRIYERDGHICRNCGSSENLTLDHIVPQSKGGSNAKENLQTLCRRCNVAKGDRMPA